jgi:DNA-binding LacI/PurR family transcriptional regulator
MLGWLDALGSVGVEPVVVHCAVSAEDAGFDAVGPLLAGPDRPTALLCFSDALAAGALRAARDAGLDVPADLTIVGFDDSPLAQRTDPPLTTVRQDAVEKGRVTAAALVDALDRRRAGRPQQVEHIVLPTELVVRASSAAPNAR